MSMTVLIEKLNAMAETMPRLEESERRQLLQACDKLKNKLETPFDLAARLVLSVQVWSSSNSLEARRRSQIDQCRLVTKVDRYDESVKIDEVAKDTGAEPLLVGTYVPLIKQ
ncbi:hypothetical protein N7454_006971 [Penicillium verhagenii]|nr:hypothetical protein N7454_006971 [Penicillium verhagenii]